MAVLATDDFNRANNTDTGTNWTVATGLVRFGIVSNTAQPSDLTGSDDGEYYNAVTPPNDQYAKCKVSATVNPADASFNGGGPSIRHATGAQTFYSANVIDDRVKCFKCVAGTYTLLGTYSTTWADGDTVYIEAQSTAVKVKINTVERISVTDSAVTSGRGGIVFGTTSSASAFSIDDWEVGDFTGGGTGYTQSVAGTLTPAGAPVKQTQRKLTGGVTPAGVLVKSLARVLAGSLTASGALIKQTARALAGALTPSGALSAIKLALKSLAGAITPTGALVKQTSRTLAGSLTPIGALIKQTARLLTGGLTPTGAVTASSVFLKSLAGALTPAGALVKSTLKVVAGTLTPVAIITRAIATARTVGSLAPTGAVVKAISRALDGALSFAGSAVGVILSGIVSIAGIIDTSTLARYLPFSTQAKTLPNATQSKERD